VLAAVKLAWVSGTVPLTNTTGRTGTKPASLAAVLLPYLRPSFVVQPGGRVALLRTDVAGMRCSELLALQQILMALQKAANVPGASAWSVPDFRVSGRWGRWLACTRMRAPWRRRERAGQVGAACSKRALAGPGRAGPGRPGL
jgi:hypothetical protein